MRDVKPADAALADPRREQHRQMREDRRRRCLVWTPENPKQCGAPATHVEYDATGLAWFVCPEHRNSDFRCETIEAFFERVDAGLCAELLGAS